MSEIYVALIGLLGSVVGAAAGIILNTKLITYRIGQLENAVNKHNNIIERMYDVEARLDVQEEKIAVANHRIQDLENSKPTPIISDNRYVHEK